MRLAPRHQNTIAGYNRFAGSAPAMAARSKRRTTGPCRVATQAAYRGLRWLTQFRYHARKRNRRPTTRTVRSRSPWSTELGGRSRSLASVSNDRPTAVDATLGHRRYRPGPVRGGIPDWDTRDDPRSAPSHPSPMRSGTGEQLNVAVDPPPPDGHRLRAIAAGRSERCRPS